MPDAPSTIRHDYHARYHGPTRSESSIRWFVVHDMEFRDPVRAAEACGAWFSTPAAPGTEKGSTQFGIDNDSTQRYLPCNVIPYGAASNSHDANELGVHCECAGVASLTRAQWLAVYGPMLRERLPWLIAHECQKHGLPLRHLTVAELRAGKKGIITHRDITIAFGVTGGHTDPGTAFPIDAVVDYARQLTYEPLKPRQKRRLRWRLERTDPASLRWLRRLVNRLLRRA